MSHGKKPFFAAIFFAFFAANTVLAGKPAAADFTGTWNANYPFKTSPVTFVIDSINISSSGGIKETLWVYSDQKMKRLVYILEEEGALSVLGNSKIVGGGFVVSNTIASRKITIYEGAKPLAKTLGISGCGNLKANQRYNITRFSCFQFARPVQTCPSNFYTFVISPQALHVSDQTPPACSLGELHENIGLVSYKKAG